MGGVLHWFPALESLKEEFNTSLMFACALLVISSFTWGFDNQGYATIQAMDSFTKDFGELGANGQYSLATYFLSYLNSFQYIGFAFGLIIGSYVSAKFGRKWSIRIMSCYSVATAIVSITSKQRNQILAGRVLSYVFVGMEASTIPVFQAEITPARSRGFLVGAFQLSLSFGGLIIHIITNSTSSIDNSTAWRIPVGLFVVFPTIVGIAINFVPESPRWLLLNGKKEDAWDALNKLRKGKFTTENIEEEFLAIQNSVEQHLSKESSYMDLIKGTNLKRTLICIFTNIFQQITGQAFASQYGAIFIKSLGGIDPFKMTIGTSVLSIGFVFISLLVADKVGRKNLFNIGSLLQVAGLMAMGGIGTKTTLTTSDKDGIVACMFLFLGGFSLGWAPLTYVVITEVPSINLRDKTQRVGYFFNILFAFAVAFSLPYLLNDDYAGLHSKVGFIYGAAAVLSVFFVHFCVPECKGKSLEEIDYLFQHKVPIRQFQSHVIDKTELTSSTITITTIADPDKKNLEIKDKEHV